MTHRYIKVLIMLVSCALFSILLAACSASGRAVVASDHYRIGNGPPSHAPAHGYRAKHTYHYYPNLQVYFDVSERVYFYQEGDRWCVSASLPDHIAIGLGDHVVISMDSEVPYTHLASHKQKYPPGQMKKK